MNQQSGLPAAYQQVEWIGASGTQYIATNYVPAAGVSAELEYELTDIFSGDKVFFGCSQTSAQVYVELYDRDRWYCSNGNKKWSNVNNSIGIKLHVKHKVYMDDNALTVDENSKPPNSTTGAVSIPIYIFAWNKNGTAQYFHTSARIYKLSFSENGILSADYIPCIRKSDNKPGMYDTVSKSFFTNAGTGEFIIPT